PPMRNALISGLLIGTAFGLAHLGFISHFAEIFIYIGAIILGGCHWGREGIEKFLEDKEIGIEALMMAAAFGSAMLGMWDEAAFLVFLYGAAEGLEEYTYAKTKHSISKLLDLAPKKARVLINGNESTIPAGELRVGNVFLVRPGESIPTDGIIIKGQSRINQASVTGESLPKWKREGETVFATTINQEGALEIRATAAFQDNTLAKMIHLVQEAQEQKGRTQLFIERFGKRYSPFVLFSALLLIAIPPLLGLSLSDWATRAVVLLVAAAPCALVMSTPVAIAAGIGKAGQTGVLIKGGVPLENLGKIRAVAFDKTGTLTKGNPIITDIMALNGEEKDLLQLAYSVEKFSEHPLARAIVKKAEETGIPGLKITGFTALAGEGVKASLGPTTVYVGKPGFFKRLGLVNATLPQIERLKNEGKTIVLVGTGKKLAGIIAIRDEIRPQAKKVIEELHRIGIKTIMVTGDSELAAEGIAKELGVNEIRADLKPDDKVNAIKDLKVKYGAIAMVGDGINDAPALATATLGIAMGTAGTDAAIEAADVALMGDDLTKVLYAVNLGRTAKRISTQNIIFSLLVLAVLIPSALIGIMSVALAVFFHEASELLAVANGLRVAREGIKN
ncbi:MAG: heavy metal translocating P-type ATPase, partial [Nitrospinales bacterium]